jgi:hypothetical protein
MKQVSGVSFQVSGSDSSRFGQLLPSEIRSVMTVIEKQERHVSSSSDTFPSEFFVLANELPASRRNYKGLLRSSAVRQAVDSCRTRRDAARVNLYQDDTLYPETRNSELRTRNFYA